MAYPLQYFYHHQLMSSVSTSQSLNSHSCGLQDAMWSHGNDEDDDDDDDDDEGKYTTVYCFWNPKLYKSPDVLII